LPPGTSNWNKIAHRLFSCIAINGRGKPRRRNRTVVQLIAAVTSDTGLTMRAELNKNKYSKGVKVSDAEKARHQPLTPRIPWRPELDDLTLPQSPREKTNRLIYLRTRPHQLCKGLP
jgi:hypothetical protein